MHLEYTLFVLAIYREVMSSTRNTNDVDIHVGRKIRLFRLQTKMSQDDLASQIGVTRQQLHKYEQGANRVGASRLWEISSVLGTDVKQFFEGIDTSLGSKEILIDPFQALQNSNDGYKIAYALSKVSAPELRKQILAIIRTLGSTGEIE